MLMCSRSVHRRRTTVFMVEFVCDLWLQSVEQAHLLGSASCTADSTEAGAAMGLPGSLEDGTGGSRSHTTLHVTSHDDKQGLLLASWLLWHYACVDDVPSNFRNKGNKGGIQKRAKVRCAVYRTNCRPNNRVCGVRGRKLLVTHASWFPW